MLNELLGFEWDVHNVSHIALHDVAPEEVEQTARHQHVIIPAASVRGENRWKLFGRTDGGRRLVVFTIRRKRFRTVTAYTMNEAERRTYGPEIDE